MSNPFNKEDVKKVRMQCEDSYTQWKILTGLCYMITKSHEPMIEYFKLVETQLQYLESVRDANINIAKQLNPFFGTFLEYCFNPNKSKK